MEEVKAKHEQEIAQQRSQQKEKLETLKEHELKKLKKRERALEDFKRMEEKRVRRKVYTSACYFFTYSPLLVAGAVRNRLLRLQLLLLPPTPKFMY